MSFLKKLREKPERERKKILWISVFLIAILLITIWILQLKFTLKTIKFDNVPLPAFDKKEFQDSKEELRGIKDSLKGMEEELKSLEEESEEIDISPDPSLDAGLPDNSSPALSQ